MTAPDPFTGIFDDLKPEDFKRDTSGITFMQPSKKFRDFVSQQLWATQFAWSASRDSFNTLGVLSCPYRQSMFASDADETVGQYITRLHREATLIGANRMFVAVVTKVRTYFIPEADPAPDAENNHGEVPEGAADVGELTEAVWFYAEERRPDGTTKRKVGFMKVLSPTLLDRPTWTDSGQSSALFRRILDGVPPAVS